MKRTETVEGIVIALRGDEVQIQTSRGQKHTFRVDDGHPHFTTVWTKLAEMPEPESDSIIMDKNGCAWQESYGTWKQAGIDDCLPWPRLLDLYGPVDILLRGPIRRG